MADPRILQTLKRYFGYDSFRPLQSEIIEHVLSGQDALVLMPTGGGKSLCYQIPALVQPGVCVVVSPLIALMRDQVGALKSNGVAAEFINSSQSSAEQAAIEARVYQGQVKLLYVSPEKLLGRDFSQMLQRIQPSLFAIDEAHCISAWGHDFRPEYTQLAFLKKQFPGTPVLALTATADKVTRRDILKQIGIEDGRTFIASFDRPNLSLNVLPGQDRIQRILRFIERRPGQSGIVYCLSRNATESVATRLRDAGIEADFYHAGLDPAERSARQDRFITDQVPIICATVAFGMGIDKPNVRWVIHYNMPKNIESYYQEIGRAGRDGLKSDTLLFYSYGDVINYQKFIEESQNQEVERAKLQRMQDFTEAQFCRRRVLLSYFGQDMEQDCGNCDVCQDPPKRFDGTVLAQKALSAILRCQEKVGLNTLVDVLKGSITQKVRDGGFDLIKTFGAGRDLSFSHWQNYLMQMLNQGLMDMAYDEENVLKTNEVSKQVLFNGRKVMLNVPIDLRQKDLLAKSKEKPQPTQDPDERLFEQLRRLRKDLAENRGVPPYVVFSDAALKDMAAKKPTTLEAFALVSGVGQKKLEDFGQVFVDRIGDFVALHDELPSGKAGIVGSSMLRTWELLKATPDIVAVARQRDLAPSTIWGHIMELVEADKAIDIQLLIPESQRKLIAEAIEQTGESLKAKVIFEHLKGTIDYSPIRVMMALHRKNQSKK